MKGDTIGVEISLPSADALSAFSFSIGKVSHIDGPIEATTFDPLRLNCTNHIDVQCAQGRFPATQADAVASMSTAANRRRYSANGPLGGNYILTLTYVYGGASNSSPFLNA